MDLAVSFSFKITFSTKEDLKKAGEFFDDENIEMLKGTGKIEHKMIGIVRMMYSNEENLTISGFEDGCANGESDALFFALLELMNKEIGNMEYTAESLCVQENEGYGKKSRYWFEDGEMKSEFNTGNNVWINNDELQGVVVAVAGKLTGFANRKAFKDFVEKFGGKVSNNITKKVHYLIMDTFDFNWSKTKKAEEIGIQILNTCEFFHIYGIAIETNKT